MLHAPRGLVPIPMTPTANVRLDDDTGVPPTGFIVVRLADRYPPRDGETLLDVAHENEGLCDLDRTLSEYRLTESTRSVIGVRPERVQEWERLAGETDGLAPLRSLLQYWRVDARRPADVIPSPGYLEDLAMTLARLPGVDAAYMETAATPASFVLDPSNDDKYPNQTYLGPPLDPADSTRPGGIDAKRAWDMGFYGTGIGFIDVEYGWFLGHEDLKARAARTFPGDVEDPSFMSHGTSVLGIVAAVDNDTGIVGIAPNVRSVAAASVARATAGVFITDAITNAIEASVPGDVILLELQSNDSGKNYPVERADDVFDAIRLASALARVVVEAAGNGKFDLEGLDLDAYVDANGQHVLKRGGRPDSGAILVAASNPGPAYTPRANSNYGSRVDCFAPGAGITTCSYDDTETGVDQSTYRDDFSSTSAAAAIVAGAAVLVQSIWRERTGNCLSPMALRALLSDPTINWPQGASSRVIGVMPNLGNILDATLPDIYLRDSTVDDGAIPSSGTVNGSPDIIVRGAKVVNPDTSFGEGSGTEQDAALSDPVVAGANHFLYARLRNRGAADAAGATVTFYWSPPSTLVTPEQWHLIGTTPPFDVPAGDTLAVSNEVAWPASQQPGIGHYCFVAVAGQAADLAPPLPAGVIAWDAFLKMVQNNNNVAWRNFNVVDALPSTGGAMTLDFVLAGAPDHARAFTLEIRVPKLSAAAVKLRVPSVVAPRLQHPPGDPPVAVGDGSVEFDLTPLAGLRAQRIVLEQGARHQCALVLEPPFRPTHGRKRLTIRQWYKTVEVGRITWEFAASRRR